MLRFISIGSGSSGNCYCLFTETDALLIDVGVGVRTLKKRCLEYGVTLNRVSNILITHDHADHVKAVGALSADRHLPVHATERVHEGIYRNYCVHKKVPSENIRFIHKDETIQIGEFKVTPFDVPHDSLDCVGYLVEHEGVTFCLLTDCGCVTDTIKPYISRANYLVIEANHDLEMLMGGPYPPHLKKRVASDHGHLSNQSCAEAIVESATPDLRHVWLCHLSEENNHPELARKTIDMHLRSHGIIIGADFELDVLKRVVPSGVYELV